MRSKVFNFLGIRSVTIAILKIKRSQKVDTYKYKIEIASNGNLKPIRMYTMLFPHTNINKLNKSIKI